MGLTRLLEEELVAPTQVDIKKKEEKEKMHICREAWAFSTMSRDLLV